MTTSIEWTDETWNPVTGCTKVSAGCKNCYAETVANRRLPQGGFTDRPFTEVRCHPDRLDAPLHWRKPRRVFVNSMSDLFHEDVPVEFIHQVFAVMGIARWHTFQILTKRPERMRNYAASLGSRLVVENDMHNMPWIPEGAMFRAPHNRVLDRWPPDNVWLGVSVENQETADERIPLLLQTPAAVRFVSYEPALGPVDFYAATYRLSPSETCSAFNWGHGISWIIIGGESGPKARPFDIALGRSVIAQCKAAGVACFVKQLGAHAYDSRWDGEESDPVDLVLRDRKGGDPAEWPADLRVREWPR